MNPEEMRVAVAELMGFYPNPNNPGRFNVTGQSGHTVPEGSWLHDGMPGGGFIFTFELLPNYLESLDACAEFEATLSGLDELIAYESALQRVLYKSDSDERWNPQKPSTCIWHAKPLQRCEAFLRVKGVIK